VRIVNRKEFLSMPSGTLFSKYTPQFFDEFRIKGDSIDEIDFYYQSLVDPIDAESSSDLFEKLDAAQGGAELPIDLHCESRDGLFESDQLFAVWSPSDVLALIRRLQEAFDSGYA
jgi:hypothetical protein